MRALGVPVGGAAGDVVIPAVPEISGILRVHVDDDVGIGRVAGRPWEFRLNFGLIVDDD